MVMAFKGGDLSSSGKRKGVTAGFKGIGHYLAHGADGRLDDRIEHFGSNIGVDDIHQAMSEMDAVAKGRTKVAKPAFHWGFSLAPGDGDKPPEQLTPEQWDAVAMHSINALGLQNHQVAWVVHGDKGHEHLHLVANRVPLDGGKTFDPSNDHYRMRETARWCELEFGLSLHRNPNTNEYVADRQAFDEIDHFRVHGTMNGYQAPGADTPEGRPVAIPALTSGDFHRARRTGEPEPWADAIEPLRTAGDWQELHLDLAEKGFRLAPSRQHDGMILWKGDRPRPLHRIAPDLSGPRLVDRLGPERPEPSHEAEPPPYPTAPPEGRYSPEGPAPDWDLALPLLEGSQTWDALLDGLHERGFYLTLPSRDDAPGGLIIWSQSGHVKALHKIDPEVSGPRIRERLDGPVPEHLDDGYRPAGSREISESADLLRAVLQAARESTSAPGFPTAPPMGGSAPKGQPPDWDRALPILQDAATWDELIAGLRERGFYLTLPTRQDAPGGLIIWSTSGHVRALHALDPEVSGPRLRDRLDGPVPEHLDDGYVPDPTGTARGRSSGSSSTHQDFWTDTDRAVSASQTWTDLEHLLAARGLAMQIAEDGSMSLIHHTGESRDFSVLSTDFERRFGQDFETYSARPDHAPPVVTETDTPVFTVDHLLDRLEAHQAVWTVDDAKRIARAFPNGNEVLASLHTSGRLVEVESGVAYSTTKVAAMESDVFDRASRLAGEGTHAVPLSYTGRLEGEHADVVARAIQSDRMVLIEGPPGSGKTTLAKAIVDSYSAAGYEVIGSSVTGKAASGLGDETGIDSRTLASWIRKWEGESAPPSSKQVILVDEASMLSLAEMQPLLERAETLDHKVIMIGDRRQLSAVGAGDPYRRLIEEHGCVGLSKIWRQKVDWMQEASNQLVKGEVVEALDAYSARDRILWTDTTDDARAAMVDKFFADRADHPDGSTMLIAFRNADVRDLNDRIRDGRRARGEIGEGRQIHGKNFAEGDRLLFRKNDARNFKDLEGESASVQNGTLGTLREIAQDRLVVELDNGKSVAFDPRKYSDIDHGYAVSLYKSQGVTVDRAYVLADRHLDRAGWTVAATRHREDLVVVTPREQIRDIKQLAATVSRETPKDLIRDRIDGDQLNSVYDRARPQTEPVPSLRNFLRRGQDPIEAPQVQPIWTDKNPGPAEPKPIDPDVLDSRIRKAYVEAARFTAEPPKTELFGKFLKRVDRLEVDAARLPEDSKRAFRIDQVRALSDQVNHQIHAADVLRTAKDGLTDEYQTALGRFEALPEPRSPATPPRLDGPAPDRLELPSTLPQMLHDKIHALSDMRHRLHVAAETAPESTPAHLVDHWRSRAADLVTREERVAEGVRSYTEALQQLKDVPPAALPDRAEAALKIGDISDTIEAAAKLRSDPLDVVHDLRRTVKDVSSGRDDSPIAELHRISRSMDRREDLSAQLEGARNLLRDMPSAQELNRNIDTLDKNLRSDLEHFLPKLYRGSPEALAQRFENLSNDYGDEAFLRHLRSEKGSELGKIPIYETNREAKLDAIADRFEKHLSDRSDAVDRKTTREKLVDQIAGLKTRLDKIPSRQDLDAASYESSRQLTPEQRTALPDNVKASISRVSSAIREVTVRKTEKLRALTSLGKNVVKGQVQHRLLTAMLPREAQRAVRLVQQLRSISAAKGAAQVTQKIATQFLPPPLRMALYVTKTALKAVGMVRGTEQDRGR